MIEIEKLDLVELCKNQRVLGYGKKLSFPLKFELGENNIVKFWYETGHGRFEPNPIYLPRFVSLNEYTFNAFGLIQAESTKQNSTFFDFTNSEPELVKFIIDYFDQVWLVNRKLWKLKIFYWKGILTKNIEEKIKKFWSNFLDISENNVKIKQGTYYRLSEKSKSEYGVVSSRINNKTFRAIVLYFLSNIIKPTVEINKKKAIFYLRGLLGGDGSIVLDKNNSIARLSLSYNPKTDEFEHYSKILDLLGFTFDKNSKNKPNRKDFQILNWLNHYKILRYTNGKPFLDHRKNIKFIFGFSNNQYVKPLFRLKKFSRLKTITYKNYANLFKVGQRDAFDCIQRLVKLNLLEKLGSNIPHVYSLTKEAKYFLNLINDIEIEIGDINER